MNNNDHYLQGVRAAQAIYKSVHYGWITKPMNPRDAMRLFWPPVDEQLVQFQTPLPPDRQAWLKGFEEEQTAIIEEEQTAIIEEINAE